MMTKIKKNVSLAPLSTFQVGGRVEFFVSVESSDELVEAVRWAKKEKLSYKVLAGGSNVVFPDEGLKGLLIQICGGEMEVSGRRVVVDAGVSLADVVKGSITSGLRGLETLSGIPGTLGGAVVGNAGAYGHSISEVVRRVEIWDGQRRRWLTGRGCGFSYRNSIFKEKSYLVLRAELELKRGDSKELRGVSRDIIKTREKKYRPGLRCPGSFFKNVLVKDVSKQSLSLVDKEKVIEGKIPSGYLLEEVGAKGMCVGGVCIADFHGNLFYNKGKATAKDVKKLARILKEKVKKKFGILLEEEIRYF